MQDFEENINDNTPEGSEPEVSPENTPETFETPETSEVPETETPEEQPQEGVKEEVAQEEVAQEESPAEESTQEETREEPVQEEAEDYFQDNDYQEVFVEEPKIEIPTVSRENIVIGEVLDKKFDEIVTVRPVRFANFDNDEQVVGPPRKNIDIMQDVRVGLTVELGRAKMKVRKLLEIAKGSIIEIDKIAGEQAELYVCGKLVARGEVIVIEDKFGIRIASIVEQKDA